MKTVAARTSANEQGFTRLDLIALAACVGVVALIQLASASGARAASMAEVCMDNQRQLILAWQLYASDHEGWFAPNPDDGNTAPGFNWVPGNAGVRAQNEFNHELLADPTRSLLLPYLAGDAGAFRCAADTRKGPYQGSDPSLTGTLVPAARSVAMSSAVGTDPYVQGARAAVNGPWLDNNHSHSRTGPWRTYGRESHLVVPGPARTAVILDEDEYSLNDSHLAFGMVRPEWIDWPATRHEGSASIAFADGHVEMHRWTDPRTRLNTSSVTRLSVPDSPDYTWLRERISAAKNP